jgi:membrane protease YdiL (CAAX protease family)
MRTGSASGLQVAFLTFALLLLSVPASNALVRAVALTPEHAELARRALPLALLGVVLLFFPVLRKLSLQSLAQPLPRDQRLEVLMVAIASLAIPFAVVGGKVAWWWVSEGAAGVAQHVRAWPSQDQVIARALSPAGLATSYLLAAILAPIAEELAFRRFLYRAWERQWGWIAGLILSSLVFALYHQEFVYAFLGGLVSVALYRRTHCLRAVIYTHATYNIAVSYLVLGQWIFPLGLDVPGDLGNWSWHLACLVFVWLALPIYVFMSRGRNRDLEPRSATDEPVSR